MPQLNRCSLAMLFVTCVGHWHALPSMAQPPAVVPIRTIAYAGTSIPDLLRTDDGIVRIVSDPLTVEAPSEAQFPAARAITVRDATAIVLIDAARVEVEFAERSSTLRTRLAGSVVEVLKGGVSPGRTIDKGDTLSVLLRGGRLSVGNVVVEADFEQEYPSQRRYLLMLGPEVPNETAWVVQTDPVLVVGDLVVDVEGLKGRRKSTFDGLTLSAVKQLIAESRQQ